MAQQYIVSDSAEAPLRGAYEITLTAAPGFTNGFLENDLHVTFTRADGRQSIVNGFYDGGNTFKARAYLDSPGEWTWSSTSANTGLGGKSGAFTVVAGADLPGKLRKSTEDPRQFVQDNGEWFLHIGDTGYRYLNSSEPQWQAYIDQSADMGATKVRTWFGTPGGGSNGNISYMFPGGSLNLAELQAADQRLVYALNKHPEVQMQVIPFGEDHARLQSYNNTSASDHALVRAYTREIQARYGALPNVQWALVNDRSITTTLKDSLNALGADWAAMETQSWGTLLTTHQNINSKYAFADAPWSSIITFQKWDEVAGKEILSYRPLNGPNAQDPIILEEDRYETWQNPAHDRYYYRRMMWASLLSGGAATYGGGETWKVYAANTAQGVQGYRDLNAAGKLQGGADDFKWIHKFFQDTEYDLIGLQPADALVGNDPLRFKAIRGDDLLIAYLANPAGTTPKTDNVSASIASLTVGAGLDFDKWFGFWFDPRSGAWTGIGQLDGAHRTFTAPAGGDWLLVLRRTGRDARRSRRHPHATALTAVMRQPLKPVLHRNLYSALTKELA